MHQADAQQAAAAFHAEALRKIHGVEIAIPSENATLAEERGDCRGMVITDTHRNGGIAFRELRWIADAIKFEFRNFQQASDESSQQRALIRHRRAICG